MIDNNLSLLFESRHFKVIILSGVILILSGMSFYLGEDIGRFLYTLFH